MIALARKYRPKKFADLLVQEHVAAVLRGAVAASPIKVQHAKLAPRGGHAGKVTAVVGLVDCPRVVGA